MRETRGRSRARARAETRARASEADAGRVGTREREGGNEDARDCGDARTTTRRRAVRAIVACVVACVVGARERWRMGAEAPREGRDGVVAVSPELLATKTVAEGLLARVFRAYPRAIHSKWVNPRRRVWLAVLGECFDVTLGAEYYVGDEGDYASCFAGRDASRAFATGDFTPEGCVDDVEGLSGAELDGVRSWATFMREKYEYVGVVAGGRFYDADGRETETLARVKRKIAAHEASDARRRERALMFPDCSSSWSEKEGGFVWCDADSDGAPRFPRNETVRERVDDDDVETTFSSRCACYPDVGVSNARTLYPGCEMTSARCRTSLPGE